MIISLFYLKFFNLHIFLNRKSIFLWMLDNTTCNLAIPTSSISPLLSLLTFSHTKLLLDPSHTPCICINCSFNMEFPIFFTLTYFTRLSRLNVLEKPCSPSICHINIIYIFLCFFLCIGLEAV